ncbi:hypothetical protein GQX74_015206 [Glossina fuscipes]|nr:hypothetical protein GQX74_015206 [Glossina fuscipes]
MSPITESLEIDLSKFADMPFKKFIFVFDQTFMFGVQTTTTTTTTTTAAATRRFCCIDSLLLSTHSEWVLNAKGFTYVAPSILEEMQRANRMPARSPRRTPRQTHDGSYRLQFPAQRGMYARATPPHVQTTTNFPPRPSPQDEMMDVQGLPMS